MGLTIGKLVYFLPRLLQPIINAREIVLSILNSGAFPLTIGFLTSNCLKEKGKYPFPFNGHHERKNTMPLTHLVIVLIVVGVLLWVINRYIPMQATIKNILNVVVIIVVIIWLLSLFGIIDALHGIRVGK